MATITVLKRTAVKENPKSLTRNAPKYNCQPNIAVAQPLYAMWPVRASICAVFTYDQSSMMPISA
jgi:hypothetical protein